jgi:hypothetical protein
MQTLTSNSRWRDEECDVLLFIACGVALTTDFKHRRTAAFENQRLYGQIECAIGGCLQGIVRATESLRLCNHIYLKPNQYPGCLMQP